MYELDTIPTTLLKGQIEKYLEPIITPKKILSKL